MRESPGTRRAASRDGSYRADEPTVTDPARNHGLRGSEQLHVTGPRRCSDDPPDETHDTDHGAVDSHPSLVPTSTVTDRPPTGLDSVATT